MTHTIKTGAAALWLTVLGGVCTVHAAEPTAFEIPEHGAVSRRPAAAWESAFVTGNGRQGAMVFGHPTAETVIANHCRLFLPLGSREILPDLAEHVPELRRIIREKGYNAAGRFFLEKAREQGFPGLIWTDPFHPGFILKARMGKPPAPAEPGGDVYLTLEDAVRHRTGWGTARTGASVTGAPLRIGSVTFRHGIGTHAPAELVYDLGGRFTRLTFHAGISAEMVERGSITVEVHADGTRIFESPVLRIGEEPRYFSVPVAGVRELRLVATDAGDGIGADHACFGNLRLCSGTEEPARDDPSPDDAVPGDRPYLRSEDFRTGEVTVVREEEDGIHTRRLFVSRPHNAIVWSIRGPRPGSVDCELLMEPIAANGIDSTLRHDAATITCRNVYTRGKGGYCGAVRIVSRGGTQAATEAGIRVTGADEVLAIMRIVPWKIPVAREVSEAWAYSPDNPDFARDRLGVFDPNPPPADSSVVAYATNEDAAALLPALVASLAELPPDYEALLAPHAAEHGALFDRVRVDFGGGADRAKTTEELLDTAARDNVLPPALLEKMVDAGRYMFICSAGELPPNLQGLWTGTWTPDWSGDFTLDTNLQLALKHAFSGNLAELMEGTYRMVESFYPDWRLNAERIYGCRGFFSNPRASNNCLMLHWGDWPGVFWTGGAAWLSHFFTLHHLYTGDRQFLETRTLPLLREVAAFYEDFMVRGVNSGMWEFIPSYSPESGCGVTATMDVMLAREVFESLAAAARETGIDRDRIPEWEALPAALPPYRINADGALAEWVPDGYGEAYPHRHLSHLHAAYEATGELSPNRDPDLWEAAREATRRRIAADGEQSSHGRMHMGLAAAHLGLAEEAYGRVKVMATRKSMYASLMCSHEPGQRIFNVDANGAIPEIVFRMLIRGTPGHLDLLPALPAELPRGEVRGIRAPGGILIRRLAWNRPEGRLELELQGDRDGALRLSVPDREVLSVENVRERSVLPPDGSGARVLNLRAGQAVALVFALPPGTP